MWNVDRSADVDDDDGILLLVKAVFSVERCSMVFGDLFLN